MWNTWTENHRDNFHPNQNQCSELKMNEGKGNRKKKKPHMLKASQNTQEKSNFLLWLPGPAPGSHLSLLVHLTHFVPVLLISNHSSFSSSNMANFFPLQGIWSYCLILLKCFFQFHSFPIPPHLSGLKARATSSERSSPFLERNSPSLRWFS